MGAKDNLWADIINRPVIDSAENVRSIMKQQCDDVKTASRGALNARFIELAYTTKKTSNIWTSREIAQQFSGPKTVTIEETALDLDDANDSYVPSEYAFDLFSSKYKFRVLTMKLGAVYPLDIVLDDDIFNQTNDLYPEGVGVSKSSNLIVVHNDNELTDSLKVIISENEKMKFIVQKMIHAEKDSPIEERA